jgi:hypothetical protein
LAGSGDFAGPELTAPVLASNELLWQRQRILLSLTSATVHPWWVHTELKALKVPEAGWVTTAAPTILPPPTGTSALATVVPDAGVPALVVALADPVVVALAPVPAGAVVVVLVLGVEEPHAAADAAAAATAPAAPAPRSTVRRVMFSLMSTPFGSFWLWVTRQASRVCRAPATGPKGAVTGTHVALRGSVPAHRRRPGKVDISAHLAATDWAGNKRAEHKARG